MAWSDSINIGNYDSKDGEITAVTFQSRAMRHKIVAYRYDQNARSKSQLADHAGHFY